MSRTILAWIVFLADQYEEYTRSFLQKLIDQGNVSINGISVKKSGIKLKENDEVSVTLPEPQPLEVVAEDIPLDILYEDDDVILINKPKGMVVATSGGSYIWYNRECTSVSL